MLPDTWLVGGRAYEDVRVGDIVGMQVASAPDAKELLQFKVVAATTYGELVPELNEGLTGGLTLVGKHSEHSKQMRKSRYLVAIDDGAQ